MVAVKGPNIGKGKKATGEVAGDIRALRAGRSNSIIQPTRAEIEEAIAAGGVSPRHTAVDDTTRKLAGTPVATSPVAAAEAAPMSDRVVYGVGSALGVAQFAAMPAMLAAGLAKPAVTEASELAKLGWFARQKNSVGGFLSKFTTPTFGDVGKKLGMAKPIGSVAQPVAEFAGKAAESAGNLTGFSKWRYNAHLRAGSGHLTQLGEELGALKSANSVSALQGHIDAMHSAASVAHPSKFDAEKFGAAHKAFGETSAKLGEQFKNDKKLLQSIGEVESKVTKIAGRAEKVMIRQDALKAYGNVAEHVAGIPKAVSKTSALHGAMHGVFVAGSAYSMVSDAWGFKKELSMLKQMISDITGKPVNKISTMNALFGDVPAPARIARARMLKFTAVSEITDAIGLGLMLKQRGMGMVTSMIAFAIPDQISKMTGDALGPSVLPIYKAMSEAHKAGKRLSAEDYETLLFVASPELKTKGEHSAFLTEIASQFAQKNASPLEVMKAIDSGEITAQISRIIVANEDAKKAAMASAEVASEPTILQTERLKHGGKEHPLMQKPRGEKIAHGPMSEKIIAADKSTVYPALG